MEPRAASSTTLLCTQLPLPPLPLPPAFPTSPPVPSFPPASVLLPPSLFSFSLSPFPCLFPLSASFAYSASCLSAFSFPSSSISSSSFCHFLLPLFLFHILLFLLFLLQLLSPTQSSPIPLYSYPSSIFLLNSPSLPPRPPSRPYPMSLLILPFLFVTFLFSSPLSSLFILLFSLPQPSVPPNSPPSLLCPTLSPLHPAISFSSTHSPLHPLSAFLQFFLHHPGWSCLEKRSGWHLAPSVILCH